MAFHANNDSRKSELAFFGRVDTQGSGIINFVVQKGQSAYSIFKTLYADWPYWVHNWFPDLATQDVQLLLIEGYYSNQVPYNNKLPA
jgi:hypothetical protein